MRSNLFWLIHILLLLLLFSFSEPKLYADSSFHKTSKTSHIEGILRESLRSNRVQACDGERITLSCPRNTQIMVQTGFYGRVVPESQLCPPPAGRKSTKSLSIHHSSTCDVIQAHTRISEICDKRRKCTVVVDSHTFEDDPCPSTSKYLQMSYACMPVSFDDETFCSNSEMRLECREGRRLAVYSAHMKTSAQCSPMNKTLNECSSDVLPQVLKECHAKDGCTLYTDNLKTFCHDAHLHIVYVCVNEEIFSEEAIKGELTSLEAYLKEASSSSFANNQQLEFESENEKNGDPDEDKWERIVEAGPEPIDSSSGGSVVHQINNDASYVTHDEYRMENNPSHENLPAVDPVEPNLVGVSHDVLQVATFFKQNKDKVMLCALLAIMMAVAVILIACIVTRLCIVSPSGSQHKGSSSSRSRHSLETSRLVPSTYGGTITPTVLLHDIEDESYLRYSLGSSSKPTSHYSHYDF